MDDQAVKLLRVWTKWGGWFRQIRRRRLDWEPISRLIKGAREVLILEARWLKNLLDESKQQLDPLDDPLLVDLGLHRWLESDREEAYSDWLKWVVEQIKEPESVFELLDLELEDTTGWCNVTLLVERELTVPKGHPGHKGRLDLVIRIGSKALIVIEVKKAGADEADTAKHTGYQQWLGEQPELQKHSVLLATTATKATYDGFQFRSWSGLCIRLRQMVGKRSLLRARTPLVACALILAFVGAVEQNLLKFSATQVLQIIEERTSLFNANVVDYLKKVIGYGGNNDELA